jgi:hypothetical protein
LFFQLFRLQTLPFKPCNPIAEPGERGDSLWVRATLLF